MRYREAIYVTCGIIILMCVSINSVNAIPIIDAIPNSTYHLVPWDIWYKYSIKALNDTQNTLFTDPVIDVGKLDTKLSEWWSVISGKEKEAEGQVQDTEAAIHYLHMVSIESKIDLVFNFILILLNIVWECIKLVYYLLSFYLVGWLFISLIPSIFIKIRDNFSTYYINTRGRRK